VFGECRLWEFSPADDVDLYPDVYIGRLACRNEEEVRICVNKIVNYEKNQSVNSDWFNNIVAVGGDTFTEDFAGINEGEHITESILFTMRDFSGNRLWGTNRRLYQAQNVSDAIEEGAGFVCFEGHAGSNSFRTHPPQQRNEWIPMEWYRTYHIHKLTNIDMLPIITIDGCNTCRFDAEHECFGWSFVVNPWGGGIGTIGMTSLSWIYPGYFCRDGLGGLIHLSCYTTYVDQNVKTLGEMWGKSIIHYLNTHPYLMNVYDYKTLASWELLGDPTLGIVQL
jgi:hypothetical protein